MAIKVFITEPIDGLTDRSDFIDYARPCNFSLVRGQRGSASIPFTLDKDTDIDYRPTVGAPVFIYEIDEDTFGDVIVYAGTIDKWQKVLIGNGPESRITLPCVSLEQCFDTIKFTRAYFGMLTGDIAKDIYNSFCTGVPVSLGDIADGVLASIVFRNTSASDAFTQLAALASQIWGVKVSDQTLYMRDEDVEPAPFVLDTYLVETGELDQNRADYRNRQLLQGSFLAFSTSNQMFSGSGTTFTLPVPVDRVVSAMLTTSTQATAVGSFGSASPSSPSNPAPGDTFTITPPHNPPVVEDPYTFVDVLDNTLRNQILIGATPEDTCQNTVDAINANPETAGITYSLPTWENDACNADQPTGALFILRVRNPGSGGNSVELTTDSATFQWDNGALSPLTVGNTTGGTDGTTSALNVGVKDANTLTVDVQYTPGSAEITIRNPIPGAQFLSVAYYRLGGDTIALEDSAAVAERATIEHGSGLYVQLITDTNNTSAKDMYEKARAALANFNNLPQSFQFMFDKPLLSPGMLLTITLVGGDDWSEQLAGTWLVQEVQGTIVPGLEELPEPWGHFRYTVTVINTRTIGTFVDFWENLAIVSPSGAQTVNNTDIVVSTPSLGDSGGTGGGTDATGNPTSGIPIATQGQLWIQETVTLTGPKKGALHWVPIRSQLTGHQQVSLTRIIAATDSTPRITQKLDPFRYNLFGGYALAPIDTLLGPDYILASNKITFKDAPGATENYIAEYFGVGAPLTIRPGLADLWVAVHDDPGLVGEIVMTSDDGLTWEAQTTPITDSGSCIGKGGGLFMIGSNFSGVPDQIATSPDGVTWTSHASPAESGEVISIAYGHSTFAVLFNSDGVRAVMTSTDGGVTWANNGIPSFSISWESICFSSDLGIFVAVGNGSNSNSVMTSPDGITWTDRTVTDGGNWLSVVFGNGLFVAMGGPIGSGVHLMTSADGASWTSQPDPGGSTASWTCVCFDGTQFVAVAPFLGGDHVVTSLDGLTWTVQTAAADRKWQAVAGDGAGNFVAVQNQSGSPTSAAMQSADGGTSWTLATTPASATFCQGVIFGGDS